MRSKRAAHQFSNPCQHSWTFDHLSLFFVSRDIRDIVQYYPKQARLLHTFPPNIICCLDTWNLRTIITVFVISKSLENAVERMEITPGF